MNELLATAGVLVLALAAAAAIVLPPGRPRVAAMLIAAFLAPVLICGDQWHSAQLSDIRDDPTRLAASIAIGFAAVAALMAAFRRWPILLPLAIVAALPFRVPLEAGGDTANLLVPLYLVIGAAVLTTALRDCGANRAGPPVGGSEWGDQPEEQLHRRAGGPNSLTGPAGPAVWLPRLLATVVMLYALQTLYSPDFSKSLQNVCFFFAPFSLVYALLRDVEWDRRLLTAALAVVAVEAVAFVLVGSVEYLTRSLFWNDQVIRSNEFHTYFRVNSIFWDPNIYGRYLALTIVLAMSALLWAREHRSLALLTGLVAVLWVGLVPTFSQSSFAALLVGLAALAALRWSWRWTLAALGAGAALVVVIVLFAGGVSKINPSRLNIDTGGRANLVSGGSKLFAQRPLWGYGAGSFPRAYREHAATRKAPVAVSHTEPVTVAAEQGLIGLAAYGALLVVALWTMASGLWSRSEGIRFTARAAVFATFVALLVHTMAYAGFYEDPITWALLALAVSLARPPSTPEGAGQDKPRAAN